MRFPAVVTLKDTTKLNAETIDISLGGVGLLVSEKIRIGQYCAVTFDALLKDGIHPIVAFGQIIYSIGPTDEGYTVGLQFLNIAPTCSKAIKELLD